MSSNNFSDDKYQQTSESPSQLKMRRAEREITDHGEIIAILNECKVCRLGIQDEVGFYIVPVNFGFTYSPKGELTLFFHSALAGRKTRALEQQRSIAFEMDCEHQLVTAPTPCQYSYAYKSIIGNGRVCKLTEPREKMHAMQHLMKHLAGEGHALEPFMMNGINVYQITASHFSAKHRPQPS